MNAHSNRSAPPLWTSQEAAQATGGHAPVAWQATGVSIDTRTLQKGDLFVALKDIRDGHDFVALALEKGAAAALVSHIPAGLPADAPLLVVPDVLAALEQLGRFARARSRARVRFSASRSLIGPMRTRWNTLASIAMR